MISRFTPLSTHRVEPVPVPVPVPVPDSSCVDREGISLRECERGSVWRSHSDIGNGYGNGYEDEGLVSLIQG